MQDAGPQHTATTTAHPSRAGLGLRLAVALGASALVGIVLERLLAGLIPMTAMRYLISSLVATGLVGVALYHLVVSPLARSRADLTVRYEAALADALADPLTGLGNHRAFQEELDRQADAAQRYSAPVSLVLIDLDDFKCINDRHGHDVGDRVLRSCAAQLRSITRSSAGLARIGGEEFAAILPGTDITGAANYADRCRQAIAEMAFSSLGHTFSLSASLGVACWQGGMDDSAALVRVADERLYAAKRAGKNCVVSR